MRRPRQYEYPKAPEIVIGFDSEWVFERTGENRILSWQFAVLNAETDKISFTLIRPKGPERCRRISLDVGLAKALQRARKEGVIDRIPKSLTLAGHFLRADLSTLKDFPGLRCKAEAIRKTFATTTIPPRIEVPTKEGPIICNVRQVDTLLLSPTGSPLAELGWDLGILKVELPEGYSKDRMDRFLEDCPNEFARYALTDAEIAARWVTSIRRVLRTEFDIRRPVPTLSAASVELVRKHFKELGQDLNAFLGQEKARTPFSNLVPLLATAAQAYHGGYNQALALGFSPEDQPVSDVDLVSAYTTALAFIQVPDWKSTRQTCSLDELAVVEEAMAVALVRFAFPAETRFPCLPVRASKGRGLVYPLEGKSWCTGPELVVARNRGAAIDAIDGYRVDWVANSIRPFENITRKIGAIRAAAKARGDTIRDKTVKEIGNSIYGKLAQAVAGTRIIPDDIEERRIFDTRWGSSQPLKQSAISNALLAAYVTGLVLAMLIEAISALPTDTWIGTATTDGFLFAGNLSRVSQTGTVARAFSDARRRIMPANPAVWEVKHVVPRVLVTKTRGTFTAAPPDWSDPRGPVLAKAGYSLPDIGAMSETQQCAEWIDRYRARTYDTQLSGRTLTSLRRQYFELVDLQNEERQVRWNADFDMKRRLVNVRDVDGLIAADTAPWQTIEDFYYARDSFDDWRASQRRVLKTATNFADWMKWSAERPSRRATGTRSDNCLSPVANAILKALAHRLESAAPILTSRHFPAQDRPNLAARAARLMTALTGKTINEMAVKNARRRGASVSGLRGSIRDLSADDRVFLGRWLGMGSIFPEVSEVASMLCADGSPAALELPEIVRARPAEEIIRAILDEGTGSTGDSSRAAKPAPLRAARGNRSGQTASVPESANFRTGMYQK